MMTTDKVSTRATIDAAGRLRDAGRHLAPGEAVPETRCVPDDAARLSLDLLERRGVSPCPFANTRRVISDIGDDDEPADVAA
ncbi:MAG: hypothetical protein HIU92_20015 [Proteobacteria bacterium]|nr:hypothetical protein [Pseudomonadota bacterium]